MLDDAIAKAKEAEDWQLVEWLRMARGGESAARWYTTKLREASRAERKLLDENAKLRELVRDVVLLAGVNGVDVTKMQLHAHGGDWRTVWERMRELGVVE